MDVAFFIGHWGICFDLVPLFGLLQVKPLQSFYFFLVTLIFVGFYSHFWPSLPLAANMAGMSHMLLSSPVFWWGLIMAPATALLPDFSIKTYLINLLLFFFFHVYLYPLISIQVLEHNVQVIH